MATKTKTCKAPGCKNKFTSSRPFQTWCSFDCAIVLADIAKKKKEAAKARIERKEHREAKIKAKTRGDWMRETQAAFNAYIRARDEMAGYACISCSQHNRSSWDAGHYRAKSVAPALRFDECNVHRQCVQCNQHQHGNLIEYRIGLIKRIGVEKVEWLEGPHEPKHYSINLLLQTSFYEHFCKEVRFSASSASICAFVSRRS